MDDNSSSSSSSNSGVNEYFNQCDTIPESKNSRDDSDINFSVNDLRPGKQIRIFKDEYKKEQERERDRDIENDIYVIVRYNKKWLAGNDTIEIKSTVNDNNKTISLDRIFNIVNINPKSLYIDNEFLVKIQNTDPNYLNNKDALKITFKQQLIAKLKAQMFNKKDSLVAYNNEKTNIETKQDTINMLLNDISIIKKNVDIVAGINYIRRELKGLYYIKYFKAILDALNVDKQYDTILNNYIFLCECLSVTVIAGALEAGFTTHSWIYIVLYNFIKFITLTTTSSPTLNQYIILPAITIYLYTNLDTIFLSVNTTINKITQLVSTILCSISTFNRIEGNIDDNITNSSESYRSSNNTIYSLSTFPSMSSLNSLYNSQIVIDINDENNDENNEKPYSEALTHDLEIITQNNSVYTPNSSLESSYDNSLPEGGKIKRSRVTKKHKRMTIRGSKKSKKMKGGKRTRSTKKRRVVRRKKCNNTKRR